MFFAMISERRPFRLSWKPSGGELRLQCVVHGGQQHSPGKRLETLAASEAPAFSAALISTCALQNSCKGSVRVLNAAQIVGGARTMEVFLGSIPSALDVVANVISGTVHTTRTYLSSVYQRSYLQC